MANDKVQYWCDPQRRRTMIKPYYADVSMSEPKLWYSSMVKPVLDISCSPAPSMTSTSSGQHISTTVALKNDHPKWIQSYRPHRFGGGHRACCFLRRYRQVQQRQNGRFSLRTRSVEFREGRILHRTRQFARRSSSAGRISLRVLQGASIVQSPT